MDLSTAEWDLMFSDLQVMEAAALQQISDDISADK